MQKIINFNVLLKVFSRILFIISGFLAFCIELANHYSEDVAPFEHTLLITGLTGLFFFLATFGKNKDHEINLNEAYLTVTLAWLMIGLAGSLPYILSGSIPDFTDAFFESVSGFTTTGSSILTDIESLPKSILFWRSLTHWIGGIGIIVLVIIIMPSLNISGYHLFTLESSLREKIKPKIRDIGFRLLIIYLVLTFLEVLFLVAGGMSLYESTCHAFATVATGGFSPRNDSIASYSPYIQYVIMIFMLLAGMNFILYYYLIKRDFKKIKRNEEVRFYLGVILAIGTILTFSLYLTMNKSFEESFREAFFQLISIITCTGFASADYLNWPQFAWLIIFMAMFFGGSTGSTAGGIKMVRHLIVFKNIHRLFKLPVHPQAIFPIKLNKKTISPESNLSILTFVTVYLIFFLIGTLLMVITGQDAATASSSVATCMAGIGPGIGNVGPASNFAMISDAGKYILIFMMLLGRLEIYAVIMLFTRSFWKR